MAECPVSGTERIFLQLAQGKFMNLDILSRGAQTWMHNQDTNIKCCGRHASTAKEQHQQYTTHMINSGIPQKWLGLLQRMTYNLLLTIAHILKHRAIAVSPL